MAVSHGRSFNRPRLWRRSAVWCVLGTLAGCGSDPLPNPVRVALTLPALTRLARPGGDALAVVMTSGTGPADGRVTVSVEPVTYTFGSECQEWVEDRGVLGWQTTADGDGRTSTVPVHDCRVLRHLTPVPDRAAFVVTIDNRSPLPFRGRGTTMTCETTAGGRRRPAVAIAGMGMAAVVVPAGGREQFTAYGPLLSDLSAGAAVGLRIAGLPPDADATGADPADRPEAVWWYAYAVRRSTVWTQPLVVGAFAEPVGAVDAPQDRFRFSATVVDDQGNVATGEYHR